MIFLNKLYSYLLLSLISILFVNAHPATIKQDIDWPQFMSQQDMIWEKLPEYWYDSAFLGNGKLGLMIYKEPGKNYLRLETGNCDVHDHRTKRDVFGIPRLLTGLHQWLYHYIVLQTQLLYCHQPLKKHSPNLKH